MSETHTGIRSPMVHTTQNGAFRLIKTVRRFQRGVSRLAGEGDIRFIHVGKTGGSAVRHALGEWSGFSKRKLILHWHDLRFTDLPAGDQAIFFLRDPVGRFVSSFYSRQRRGRPVRQSMESRRGNCLLSLPHRQRAGAGVVRGGCGTSGACAGRDARNPACEPALRLVVPG